MKMNGNSKRVKIGILDVLGIGSLGDEAIQQAMIQNVLKYLPDAEIHGFTCNPKDTRERHGIRSFPINRVCGEDQWWLGEQPSCLIKKLFEMTKSFESLSNPILRKLGRIVFGGLLEVFATIRAYQNLEGLDLLIISGGGQLDDDYFGAWYEPYILFLWAVLAKLRGVKFAVVSVGVGNISFALSRFFIKTGLSLACYRSFRDNTSKEYLADILDFRRNDPIYPDLAHSLCLSEFGNYYLRESHRTIAINPLYFIPGYWSNQDSSAYDKYLDKLANFIDWLLQNNYKVVMFSSCVGEHMAVTSLLKDVLHHQEKGFCDEQIVSIPILTVEELISQLTDVNLVIASRLHSVLLATLMNKPTIALAYHFKLDMVMQEIGQKDYCLRIDCFDVEELKQKFVLMEENYKTIQAQLAHHTQRCRARLDEQYKFIFEELIRK